MKPLLAHIYEPHRFAPGYVQPKLNGVRALYQYGNFQSREELPWNINVLRHLWVPLLKIFEDSRVILDGELYVHGWSLQRINGAVQIARSEPREDTDQVEFHIFDRVSYSLSFKDRFELMKSKLPLFRDTKIKLVRTYRVETQEQADQYYADFVQNHYEGIMYRLGDCPYTRPKQQRDSSQMKMENLIRNKHLSDKNNRCWHLLKRKDWQDGEFECVAVEEGEGKRAGMVGNFKCIRRMCHPNNRDVYFDVGSGITDAEATYYFNNPDQVIGHKIKVKFLTYTADGKPFNPTIEAIL